MGQRYLELPYRELRLPQLDRWRIILPYFRPQGVPLLVAVPIDSAAGQKQDASIQENVAEPHQSCPCQQYTLGFMNLPPLGPLLDA